MQVDWQCLKYIWVPRWIMPVLIFSSNICFMPPARWSGQICLALHSKVFLVVPCRGCSLCSFFLNPATLFVCSVTGTVGLVVLICTVVQMSMHVLQCHGDCSYAWLFDISCVLPSLKWVRCLWVVNSPRVYQAKQLFPFSPHLGPLCAVDNQIPWVGCATGFVLGVLIVIFDVGVREQPYLTVSSWHNARVVSHCSLLCWSVTPLKWSHYWLSVDLFQTIIGWNWTRQLCRHSEKSTK